jgi:cell division protein FtsI/penicillin-binding protein 2
MYGDVDDATKRALTVTQFARVYRDALTRATATGARVDGRTHGEGEGHFAVPVRVSTRLFSVLKLPFEVHVVEDGDQGARVAWTRSAAFAGLQEGETLHRRTALPRRAALLARDGSVLAEGPDGPTVASSTTSEDTRTSPLGEAAGAVLGTVGAIPASRRKALEAEGVPGDGLVGLTGMERALDDRLRGTAGGQLLAGERVLATTASRAAPPVRTSVSAALQREATAALGGRVGGIVILAPASGQVLAVAGMGLDGLQPPGSTFKMITLSGVLANGVAEPDTDFPYATYATLDGVKLHNANGEECGGSLEQAFAVSCNSVFTPLGVKLGAARLVQTAESFGFNHAPGLVGAATSSIPQASKLSGELEIGSTAIGQGEVLATPLQMALVASTIADGGRRPEPTLLAHQPPRFAGRAIPASVARTVRRLMIGVVRSGTGTASAISGVTVAGKTGTAELQTPCAEHGEGGEASSEQGGEHCESAGTETNASNTDAWFAAFAPALHPRVAVCVMLVKDGAGGDTAAPVARELLVSALQSGAR